MNLENLNLVELCSTNGGEIPPVSGASATNFSHSVLTTAHFIGGFFEGLFGL